tara:strand:- start:2433 stop:2942 length:510 start_codon:yes stop_codon:yes gene_type:complete
MSDVSLRPATLDDVALLTYWDSKPHVIACTGADDAANWAEEIAGQGSWYDALIAEAAGRPVGIVQIIDPDNEPSRYWGVTGPGYRAIDIWIGEESDLGRGLGTQMMQLALARCFSDPKVQAVLIDPLASNVDAIRFYERLGFTRVGPRRFGEDDCIVLRFDRRDSLHLP